MKNIQKYFMSLKSPIDDYIDLNINTISDGTILKKHADMLKELVVNEVENNKF